jgi:CHAT domain-containing protein/tetratricopeptide (TPR) repeat protein
MRSPLAFRSVAASLLGGASVAAAATQAGPPTADATILTQGSVIEREMRVGETHVYSIELREGEYLQEVVEQRGVDVVQTLKGPNGQTILETDSPSGRQGPDPLAVIAPVTGTYSLTLSRTGRYTPPPMEYELRVLAVREPGPLDLLRARTVKALADAGRVFRQQPAEGLARFLEALAGWEALGDRPMQMWTEKMVAFVHSGGFGAYSEAYERASHALALALDLGDERAEAQLRSDIGLSLRRLGRLDEARAELERSLSLDRAGGRQDSVGVSLITLSRFHRLDGEFQEAFDRLHEALQIFRSLDHSMGEASVGLEMGETYLAAGDPQSALEQFQLALPGMSPEPYARGARLAKIGLVHFQLGHLAEARSAYGEARGIFKTLGNAIMEADTYVGLAEIDQEEGNLRAAADALASALEVYRSRSYPLGEGLTECRLGEIRRLLGEGPAAQAAFEAALAIGPRGGASVSVCALSGLARVARDLGDLEVARGRVESALATTESSRAALASPQVRATALASQQPLYSLLIDVLMRKHAKDPSGDDDVAAFEVSERSRARSLLELLREARVEVRRGAAPELLDEERSLHRRINAAASSLVDEQSAPRPLRVEALNRDLEHLAGELAETESLIRRASPQYAALTQARPLKVAEIRAEVLDAETQLVEYELGDAQSYMWVVSPTRIDSFALGPRAAIEAAARRVHDAMARPMAVAGTEHEERKVAARELSRLILAPAAGALTARRLLVVAADALQYVPFASLPLADGEPLLSRFEVVGAPSASVIASLRGDARDAGGGARTLAVFADAVFDPSDPRLRGVGPAGPTARVASRGEETAQPLDLAWRGLRVGLARLPFSRLEADGITALAPRDTLKAVGFAASRETATSGRLAEYRIIHFATHGVVNARQPELSGVVLSLFDPRGRRQDGFLRLHDVYNLTLAADLVVLSGCQTALGKELRGEGLLGLTRGFMYAGARAVVASLWQVDDESTAELMERTYRGILKEHRRPSDALRAAQLEMSQDKRWAAPFYWAGFVIQGEWK